VVGQAYNDLADLARVCARQAHQSAERDAARQFWRMALEYQQQAAALDGGRLPHIGVPPAWFKP
jgi:hypothetical protein